MPVRAFHPNHFHNAFGSHEPVLRLSDGDTLVTSTVDAGGFDSSDQRVATSGNPMTGPSPAKR